jgi:hypothetical protein
LPITPINYLAGLNKIRPKVETLRQKPMFILVSEKEVHGNMEERYQPYFHMTDADRRASFGSKPIKTIQEMKNYAPVPIKKFNHEIIPEKNKRLSQSTSHSVLRRFKF